MILFANKILIITNHYGYNGAAAGEYTIFRGATNLGSATGTNAISKVESFGGAIDAVICYTVLDSPSTTSAITYSLRFKQSSGSFTAYFPAQTCLATIIAIEIAA